MVIRLFFVILFVFFASLNGADLVTRLESAKKSLQAHDEIEQFKAYNECKSIYSRALLDQNTSLSRGALECISEAGDKLGIDTSKYRSELVKIRPAAVTVNTPTIVETPKVVPVVSSPVVTAPVVSVPVSTVVNPPLPPLVLQSKTLEPSKKVTLPEKTLLPESVSAIFALSEKKGNTVIMPKQEVSVSMRHKLQSSGWRDGGLELIFDNSVDAKEIKISKIIESDKQRFRYIIDIDNSMLSRSETLENKQINRIKLAQFNFKTIRIVVEHSNALAIKPMANGKNVFISMNVDTSKVTAPLASMRQEAKIQPSPVIATLPPMVPITPRDRSKKIIVIDPGHGGKDSGAVGNGFAEKEIVIAIGTKLVDKLRAQGYTVYMTRSDDTFIELKDRTHFANDKQADLFISVHANSIPKTSDPNAAQGIETYFLSPTRSERSMRVAAVENSHDMNEMGEYGKLSYLSFLNKEKIIASNKLGIDLQREMLKNLRKQYPNVRDNGVREAPFWVLVGAQMPAVLVEVGYISHPEESARIADDKYQTWLAEGLSDGIARYFANNN